MTLVNVWYKGYDPQLETMIILGADSIGLNYIKGEWVENNFSTLKFKSPKNIDIKKINKLKRMSVKNRIKTSHLDVYRTGRGARNWTIKVS